MKEKEKTKKKVNVILVTTLLVSIFLLSFASAISIETIFPTTNPFITNQSTINLSWGINLNAGETLNNITESWNGTNTTLIDSSLVGYCNMDNRSSLNENDTLINCWSPSGGFNGTIGGGTNATIISNGINNNSLHFSGTNGFLNITNNITFLGDLTFCFGLNLTNYNGAAVERVIDNGKFMIFITLAAGMSILSDGVTQLIPPNSTIILDNWNYYCLVRNSTGYGYFYKDGILIKNGSSGNPIAGTTTPIIGNREARDRGLNGSIDNLIIFNRTLSANEINLLSNLQITKYNNSYYQYNQTNTISNYTTLSFLCSSNTTNVFCSNTNTILKVNNINANFSNSIGNINNYFYGVQAPDDFSEFGTVSNDMDCTRESVSDYNKVRNAFTNAGFNIMRKDMQLAWDVNYTDLNSTMVGGNRNDVVSNVKWAYENNAKILLISNAVPVAIANTTSTDAFCNSSKITCMPNNLTQWCNLNVNYINNVTNNGLYLDAIAGIEVWNEADGVSFLSNLNTASGNQSIRSREYNTLYNATYNCIKANFPTLAVGGAGVTAIDVPQGQIILNGFLGNFSNQMDFASYHEYTYLGAVDNISEQLFKANYVKQQCAIYGANCSKMYLGEWNFNNNSMAFTPTQKAYVSITLVDLLNNFAPNMTQMFWKFDSSYLNSSCDGAYNKSMYQQATPTYQFPYNVTQAISHLCPSGASVSVSSNDDSTIKQVSCKKGNQYSVIVINTDTNAKNVTLDGTGESSVKYLMDSETGTLYLSNSSNLGIMDSYDIMYLGTPYFLLNENTNLTKIAITGESYLDNNVYITTDSNNTVKHLVSNLYIGFTANITFNVDSCIDLKQIYYTPKGESRTKYTSGEFTCSNNQVTINSLTINPSSTSNEIEIEYYGCNSTTRAGYNLVMIFASLMLLLFVSYFVWNGFKEGTITVGQMIIAFVIIVVCLGLWLASGQNLGQSCGVVGR